MGDVDLVQKLDKAGVRSRTSSGIGDVSTIQKLFDTFGVEMQRGTESGNLIGHRLDEAAVRIGGDDDDGDVACVGLAPATIANAGDDLAHERDHESRMGCGQILERRLGNPGQRAVTNRSCRGHAGRLFDHAHLADQIASSDTGIERDLALVGRNDPHLPADQDVGRVGNIALLEQRFASFEGDPIDGLGHLVDEFRITRANELGDDTRNPSAVHTAPGIDSDLLRQVGVLLKPVLEGRAFEFEDTGWRGRSHGRRPMTADDGSDLADHIVGAELADDQSVASERRCRDVEGAVEDHEHGCTVVADLEQRFSCGYVAFRHCQHPLQCGG